MELVGVQKSIDGQLQKGSHLKTYLKKKLNPLGTYQFTTYLKLYNPSLD